MQFHKILITGGAGFVGVNLALRFREAFPETCVTVFDNLKRRGSELNLPRLRQHGIPFLHGDIRCREDVEQWPAFDLLIDCAAEPSVQGGLDGAPLPLVTNNLLGTIHCLEAARRHGAAFLFLSTSRVYPIERINRLAFREAATRFEWTGAEAIPGFSAAGIAEEFPLDGWRSLYGASKLSCELFLVEYAASYHVPVLINRCGVLAGPWQMGKVDQGVVTLWVARHILRRELAYFGYGGLGKQVRDILHIDDLFDLLCAQLAQPQRWNGSVYNVGGGRAVSVSLAELTALCRDLTGNQVPIRSQTENSPADLRLYLTDARRVSADFAWQPQRTVEDIVSSIGIWVRANQELLQSVLA